MSPSPARRSVLVGLFVSVGAMLLIAGVLTIGDLNDTFTRKITVQADFEEVTGLKKGDNIWFSGMKVGVVKRLDFQGSAEVAVALSIERHASRHIPSDSLAKIGSDGLIGNRIVVLYGGTPDAEPIAEGDRLRVGDALGPEEVIATLQENNVNLVAITTDLKGLVARVAAGEGTAGKLVTDEVLYASAQASASSLELAARNAEKLTASLALFTAALNQDGNLAHDLATDREIYPNLTATTADVRGLVGGLADPDTLVGTLARDEAAAADLKASLDNLNRATALLAEDLEAAQHNVLLRGFFKKRERAERKAKEPGR